MVPRTTHHDLPFRSWIGIDGIMDPLDYNDPRCRGGLGRVHLVLCNLDAIHPCDRQEAGQGSGYAPRNNTPRNIAIQGAGRME